MAKGTKRREGRRYFMKIINNPRTDHIQKKNAFAADVLRELFLFWSCANILNRQYLR